MTAILSVDKEKSTTGRSNGDRALRPSRTMVMVGAMVRGVDRLSPVLGTRFAARLFLTPRRSRIPERERQWLSQARPEVFAAGRFRLAGHRWSENGRPVLLIHGWEGRGSQLGGLALAIASQGFQPITVDLPAHGATKGAQTNLLEFAEVITSMVQLLGGVAGIVAHSFGAAGTTVAMRSLREVDRIVYLSPSEDFDHFPRVFGRMLGFSRQLSGRIQSSVERKLGATMSELRGSRIAPSLHTPLLVIHDEDDTDVPWKDGKTYSEVWPGATLLTTRGFGHRRILREPEVMNAAAEFVRGPIARH